MLSDIMETSCENSKTSICDSYGCQAIIRDNEKCGEIKSLDILKEFQQLYERKINEIEDDCKCAGTKAKNLILRDWVNDLTEQNTLLVQVVEELEHEASERVALLEDKLKNSSKTSFEIMQTLQDYDAQNISNQTDFIKKITNYQSDINNLIEYIRRIRVDHSFNIEGLHFYNINTEDIYNYEDVIPSPIRDDEKVTESEDVINKLNMELKMYQNKEKEYEEENKNRNKFLQEQSDKIDRLSAIVDRCSTNMPDRQNLLEELHELRTELKLRNEDFHRLESFESGETCKDHESFKLQIAGLEERNNIFRQTISNANSELNELREILEKYSRKYVDEKNSITDGSLQSLFRKLRPEDNITRYGDNQFISIKEQMINSTLFESENEIQTAVQNNNQYTNNYIYSDTLLLLRTANTTESIVTENGSQDSDNDFNRTMYLLKAEINKMIRLVGEQALDAFKSNVGDDLSNKEKLIRNKDEMIKIQNDSLTLAQEELKALQNKVYELETDREIKIQEIKNLRQALSLNQDSIEELKISLRNSEEKGNNTQQTENIKKILCTNEILEDDITYMNSEMKEVSKELKILQKLLKKNETSSNESMTLTKSIQILQDHSESLVQQLKLAQDQVSREIDLNQSSSLQILDLQKQLDLKTIELQRTELELKDAKSKLSLSMRQNQDYEKRFAYLEKQMNDYHMLNKSNEQKNEENFNSDINCLRQKIEMLSKILNEKSAEILKLHSDLSSKSDMVSKILTENAQLQENNAKMVVNVMNLEKQLCSYKTRCEEINSKYLICQSELETLKVITSSQEEIKKDRTVLVAKLEATRNEENKLNKLINELKLELEDARYMIEQKDENLNNNQQEMNAMKEEINRITKIRNKCMVENKKLQDQVSKLNGATSQFEKQNILISEQLEKCIEELNALQSAKTKVEERNIQLETEIGHLQRVFGELNQEIRYKQESVINLEHELTETKCSRDEICAESRIVVNNVRAWLEEHKRLNISLNSTVKEKNMIIEELTLERNLLLKNIKEVCERYETLTEELHICRQYLAELDPDEKAFSKSSFKSPFKRSVHTWGSQGSISFDSNNPVVVEPDYDHSSLVDDEQPSQDNWMQKINDLSDDIEKSKKYWKHRLSKRDNKLNKHSRSMKTN